MKVVSHIIKEIFRAKICIALTNIFYLLCVRHSAATCGYNTEQEPEMKPVYKLPSQPFLAFRLPPATTRTLFSRINPASNPS